jgi:hypothetical protein
MKIIRASDLEIFLTNLERYSDAKSQNTGKRIAWTPAKLRSMMQQIPTFELDDDVLASHTSRDQSGRSGIAVGKNKRQNPSKKLKRKYIKDE